jgi:hypothetical protein
MRESPESAGNDPAFRFAAPAAHRWALLCSAPLGSALLRTTGLCSAPHRWALLCSAPLGSALLRTAGLCSAPHRWALLCSAPLGSALLRTAGICSAPHRWALLCPAPLVSQRISSDIAETRWGSFSPQKKNSILDIQFPTVSSPPSIPGHTVTVKFVHYIFIGLASGLCPWMCVCVCV